MPTSPDLLKDIYSVDPKDKDYTLVTITDLNPGDTYGVQFAWVYPDKRATTEDSWSITKEITASTEAQPNPPQFLETDLTSNSEKIFVQWNGVDNTTPTGLAYKGVDRVEVFVNGGDFNSDLPVTSFKVAGKKSIAATAGDYIVTLKAVTGLGTYSEPSEPQSVTVDSLGETIEAPTSPNGFSVKRILAGLELSWAGTYSNGTFQGFEAIKVFVGTSATATDGTYTPAGVLTGDQVINKLVIPVDGTYCRYGYPVYIHAAAVNKNGEVGTLQQNVAHEDNGPGKATDADINDGAVVISKLASDVLTVGNLKAGDINSTSYIRAGTSTSARVEIASNQVSGTSVLAGLHIYNTQGDAILSAPLTGGLGITGGIKTSTATSYITLGAVSGISTSGASKIAFKVDGITYPGYITNESLFGSNAGSLTISPPSPYDVDALGDVPFIDLYSYSGGGSIGIYSPGGLSIDATNITIGNSSTTVGIAPVSWYPADSNSTYTTLKLLGVTQGGTLTNTNIGLWFSGAYGSSAPGSTIGQNGDLLFST